jgi:hypothetical protein
MVIPLTNADDVGDNDDDDDDDNEKLSKFTHIQQTSAK